MILSPSILAADRENIEKEITELEEYNVEWVHLDVMDGEFVPATTFNHTFVKKIRPLTKMFFDVHLMVKNPYDLIENYVNAGSDLITVHFESDSDPLETIKYIKSFGVKAGLSIKPNTEVDSIKHLLPYIDLVLVMSVEPGKGGQSFMPMALDKIALLKGGNYLIEVDGGINETTGLQCLKAGADVLVAGTFVFKNKDNINVLKNL